MSMKWLKYELSTTTEATDLIIDMLSDLGINGVEVRDRLPLTEEEKKQMYVDLLPESLPDDGEALLVFYAEVEEGGSHTRSALYNSGTEILAPTFFLKEDLDRAITIGLEELALFVDVGEAKFLSEETSDMDWADKWKEHFKSFRIGEKIIIAPSWEEHPDVCEGEILIRMDPGIAFGTGSHETTRLCVEEMIKYVKEGDRLLDVGCGSAILSIVGLKLGAGYAFATDIDETAIKAAGENLHLNEINPSAYSLCSGNILLDEVLRKRAFEKEYDMIVANILAPVLVELTPVIAPVMKKGGIYICSGIVKELASDVVKVMESAGLELISENIDGDWVSITARK